MAIVIDASIALGWLLLSQASSLTRAALTFVEQESGWVPAHFALEVTRSLRSHERRGLIAPEDVDAAIVLLQAQALKQDQVSALEQMSAILSLARTYGLRVADASYLELAMRLGSPLATRDASLTRAAQQAGATVFRA
jgi:predicted nucleic acid-binding protein